MPTTTRRIPLLLLVVSAATIAACKDSDTAPLVAQAVAQISGDSQTVSIGAATASPLVVRVIATTGALMPGVTVNWSLVQGTGALSATSSVTDSTGAASVNFTPDAAGTDIVAATAANVSTPVDFTIVATAPSDTTTSGN